MYVGCSWIRQRGERRNNWNGSILFYWRLTLTTN